MVNYIFEIVGTIAFAFSGIKVASQSRYDVFGGFVLAFCVAVGGGTVRDCMLGLPPFWTTSSVYFICTIVAMVIFFALKHGSHLIPNKVNKTIFLTADTIGLALFTIAGTQKAYLNGMPVWVSIGMGCITGVLGGVIRDVFAGLKPTIFSEDFYATASVIGAAVYFAFPYIGFSAEVSSVSGMFTIVILRFLAVRYKWHLPMV
ncbi:MAG: trimeric intracellular cation channel family protein [Bacteroidales bacterium]|nr:trimeric intracellular cation channel family protein [Bacteroidales bacterium]